MRALLLWLLMLALPVYGASGSSLRMLGPAHWHVAPAAVVQQDGWLEPALGLVQRLVERLRDVRAHAHARAHALGRQHGHGGLQRHWHDAADGSVRTLGKADPAVADLVAGAAVGSAMLVLAAPLSPLRLTVCRANGRWPAAHAPAWADAELRPAPPPPRR
ncbi:hypothetical protein [Roseateles sp.]|uniref:hypothetical protein n=1 Tax=Roseateles sp. TaxID=1971397 RepID=UPI0025D31505|nr:hypothetical protein [Roseateles sp.]MBV8034650.1 hypothetical protein [Roseateles sp.]